MADEQPAHINREVRDVSGVPLAKELVKNNVGSTVKDNSKFKAVTEEESAAVSAHYLDVATLAKHTSIARAAYDTDSEKPSRTEDSAELRSAVQSVLRGKDAAHQGPTVIMSDPSNYAGGHNEQTRRRRTIRADCCSVM